MGVSLHRGPLGEPGEGVCLQGTARDRELWKWSISLYGSSARGTCRHARRLWRLTPLPWGPRWGTWDRTHMLGAYVWKKVLGWVSLYIGAPLGNLGREVHLPGTLKIS